MAGTVIQHISRLRDMTVGQLQQEWARLYGEPSRSRNRDFLWRRLAWRVQEIERGGLSAAAHARIGELAQGGFTRASTPRGAVPDDGRPALVPRPRTPHRDPRLPTPGTVLTREYRGRELRLLVLDDGFELDGRRFGSLSEAARHVSGSRWNGPLFWGLTQRKRGK